MSEYCSVRVSRVGLSTGQTTQPYLDKLLSRTWNPSEPYSDKDIPLTRAVRRLLCWFGSQLGIHRKLGLSPLGTVQETVLGHLLRNGQNTVSRVLFRKRELAEFCARLSEF